MDFFCCCGGKFDAAAAMLWSWMCTVLDTSGCTCSAWLFFASASLSSSLLLSRFYRESSFDS